MSEPAANAVAVVGVGAILPDAPDATAFWENVAGARYSIRDVDPTRWDPALYYDPDPKAPDKTYSVIGGWVTDWAWDPLAWRLPIPPTVSDAMDDAQKWAVACSRMALLDYGWPDRALAGDRTAVILGNAMAGEKHYLTALRIAFPELARELAKAPSFAALDPALRDTVEAELHANLDAWLPDVSEDTMPGELGNCLAGRVANLFDFHGPNFVTDAACASAMAALGAAIDGLLEHDFDVALAGGVDRNMGAATYVKFCKIGALSATGTRPYADGADGFVMGEGAALFVIKRLADAERDGDRIYAVVRGVAGASDGRGKGITAPNPVGQRLAVQRAWEVSGVSPAACTLIEGHGTSTRVGDVVEVTSIGEAFADAGLAPGSVALGSVKSNIGHLKGAAGAAGLLKAILALHHRQLPPSLNFAAPNPNIDFGATPFYVNTELREWAPRNGDPRVAGVSAFGFGGTNFHVVLEEHVPGRLTGAGSRSVAVGGVLPIPSGAEPKAPLRGALVVGAEDEAGLADQLRAALAEAKSGRAPAPQAPDEAALRAPQRVAIDYGDATELADGIERALGAIDKAVPAAWRVLRGRGVFRGSGPAPTTAFLYTGQGSQYVNMLADLREVEPIVADTFAEADQVMTPLLGGRPLTDYTVADPDDVDAVAAAEEELRQTEITQPAVLTVDAALGRLLAAYGIVPDMVMGHSLGEYGALTAAGALDFAAALEAVSARGQEMADLTLEDNGALAAVSAPLEETERLVDEVEGYVVLANVNSTTQTVIGGATAAVEAAIGLCEERGHRAQRLPVSHAFHTAIVAPAAAPLRATLERLGLHPPALPIVANVTGDFYPMGPDVVPEMLDLLARQVASPVQFVAGLRSLRDAGATLFLEVGPKRALQGFASDVLGDDEVLNLFSNHPKGGGVVTFNHALCGLYAAGLGVGRAATTRPGPPVAPAPTPGAAAAAAVPSPVPAPLGAAGDETYLELGHLFADVLDRAREVYADHGGDGGAAPLAEPVVITGAALGLPGTAKVFDDANVARILHGQQFIDVIPSAQRQEIAERHITRLVKGEDGSAVFEHIDSPADVIKLAGREGAFDLAAEFGVDPERLAAFGRDTQLAVAAGIDALRDAGLPLAQRYKATTTGGHLPERWALPEAVADETGVIFASAFPGLDAFADDMNRFWEDRARRDEVASLEHLRARLAELDGEDSLSVAEVDRCIHDLRLLLEEHAYAFDRRFLFRILSMGHSQFAELVGARGPNTQVNAACASTTQALGLAEDWIRARRCRRVVIVAADDATSDHLLGWIGAGFLASGAAATDEVVEEAALPFDQRRHGMILGMGAAALVVESAAAARERGLRPICEVLGTVMANSAFHGTRLNVEHIASTMEQVVAEAESRGGLSRHEIAPETVFVSHETYTPARGGSAAAEIYALRQVFGDRADEIVIANTKGLTGHPMGVGIEDVVAVKALETGLVPPIPNVTHTDPELGPLNLSKGGVYPVRYALRLAAGFGSQIAMALLRWAPPADARHRNPEELGHAYRIDDPAAWQAWLTRVTGRPGAQLEVVDRRLRIIDQGPVVAAPTSPAPAVAPPVAPAPATVIDAAAPEAPAPDTTAPDPTAPAPAPTPTATPTPGTAAGAGDGDDEVAARVVALVAEQTGYPPDLLDLDLDLEADLGIDTVKQAEVFAAIRESYGIERDDNLKLRDYPTLASVIGFVNDRRPDTATPDPTAPTTAPTPTATPTPGTAAGAGDGDDEVAARVVALVAEQTGYPPDLLDLDLDLEADLGIDTVKQAEVFAAIRESYGIERDDNLKLRDYPTLASVIGFVNDRRPDTATPDPTAPTTAPTPTATPTPGTAAGAGDGDDEVAARVVALVAEQTGYPPDLLDLDLDLEADLGIDTVKQAEVFAAIRESYGIERDDNLKLRDYPTLASVIGFVNDRRPDTATPDPTAPTTAPTPTATPTPGTTAGTPFPRRVPVPVVRPPLTACAPTGVTLGAGSRVLLVPDGGGVGSALTARLEALGVEVLTVEDEPDAVALEQRLATWCAAGPVQGVYWLAALDDEGPILALDAEQWRAALHLRVKLAAVALRALAEQVGPPGTFLVSATRLGGRHGYDPSGATAPLGGALSGFTKALARERAEALVKVVDVGTEVAADTVAGRLVEETRHDPVPVEVGHADGLRWTIGLADQPAVADPARALGSDSVVVVTGAAGSIVAAITADLAAASGATFHLLDLVPEPDPADPDLERFVTDPDGLKHELAERLAARGDRATPRLIDRELAGIERARAALEAIEAVQVAGGAAHWHQVDLTDGSAVAAVVNDVKDASAGVDLLLHGAGIEVSHFLADKPQSEYDLVFDVKADGFFHLLHAFGEHPVGSVVVFSSIAGRFGNGGQTDYSAANDLLCKLVSSFRTTRPDTRGIAVDWTAWAGIGMASRGSIPKMMALAGIDTLPPEVGVPIVRAEVEAAGPGREIVVAGALGLLVEEPDPTGGLDSVAAGEVLRALDAPGLLSQEPVAALTAEGLIVRTEIGPAEQPFLDHHRIDDTPVLPGVMGVEAFVEAALALAPGWHLVAVEDLDFLAPFKFYRDEARVIEVQARLVLVGDDLVADCRLLGRRRLADQGEQETVHFTGRVRLARQPVDLPPAPGAPPEAPPTAVGPEDVYRIYFHGPAYRVLGAAWGADDLAYGRLADDLEPDRLPADVPLRTAPRLLELCFQAAGVHELATTGAMALPTHADRVTMAPGATESPGLTAMVTPREDGSVDAEVVGPDGEVRLRLEGYRTTPLPGSPGEDLLAPLPRREPGLTAASHGHHG